MGVLDGLRVVEVSASGAAALAASRLGDWGASITALEPSGGTPLRVQPPFYERDGQRRSAAWDWLSRGKSAVTLETADALARCLESDLVLIESELSEQVLGIAPAALQATFDGRVACVLIAPFAVDGPYAHYGATDLGIHALGGWANLVGDPGREPLRPGNDMIPRLEGICAFVAALVALRIQDRGSPPPFVELCGQAVAATMIVAPWMMKSVQGLEQNRRANDWLQGGVMQCEDGWFGCTPLTATHWEMMCHMLGIADVLDLPGGAEPAYRWSHSAELLERARPFLESASKHHLFRKAQQYRIPAAPVEDVAERLACPQLAARGFWVSAEIEGATVKVPRVPFSIQSLASGGTTCAAHSTKNAPVGRAPGVSVRPLDGVRVLDLTHFWAGPYATTLLAALGADVIKVESIQRPDGFRYTFAPAGAECWWELSPAWNDTNCGKRDVTLDLSSPAGKELFERLVEQSDVVVSNFSNRVMANLGLGPAALSAINPRIINVALPGYGPGGPWEDYVGFGIAFEQLAACASITGYEDGVPKVMSGFCDPLAGLHAVAAIELALRLREQTGYGSTVEVPQCETLDSLFAPEAIAVQLGAPVPGRRGNRHETMAPHNIYRVAGEDCWLSIAIASDAEFAALTAGLGAPTLAADGRFATPALRKANESDLDAAIGGLLAGRDGEVLERDLQARGVMACRVARGWELPEDPNLRHIGFFQDLSREPLGTHSYKTWPFRFGGMALSHRSPAPTLGQHNREVLGGLLGLSDTELSTLEAGGVIGTRPLGV